MRETREKKERRLKLDSDTPVECPFDLGSPSSTTSEPNNTAGGKSCVILRLSLEWAAGRLLRCSSVLARGNPGVPPEAVSEMTLVCIPHGQRRIHNSHARSQEIAGALDADALEVRMRRQTQGLREHPGKMERAPGRQCAELRQGYVLRIVILEVLSNLPDNEILFTHFERLSPLLHVGSGKMFDDCQQERFAIDRRRTIRNRPVQSQKSREQSTIGDDGTAEVRQIVSVGHL